MRLSPSLQYNKESIPDLEFSVRVNTHAVYSFIGWRGCPALMGEREGGKTNKGREEKTNKGRGDKRGKTELRKGGMKE